MKSHRPESDGTTGPPEEYEATDFASLMEAPVAQQQKPKKPMATDFASLKSALPESRVKRWQKHTATDWLIDALIPLMIFLMVLSFVMFLLDIRYVYTEVSDKNIRAFALFLVLGVVALNRVIARDGTEESLVYFVLLAAVTGFYTFITTGAYEVGSVAGKFMNQPFVATGFNMTLVILLWWATNRLMHECCVDENLTAGDIGILTGTARRMLKATRAAPKAPRKSATSNKWFELEAYDPAEAPPKRETVSKKLEAPAKRLQKRHPGISVFYFTAPVVFVFAIGPRILGHGGGRLIFSGWALLIVYLLSALSLLMLTSLGGIRAYFRNRRVTIPGGIGPFWVGLGTILMLFVLFGAAALPKPSWPPLLHVGEHQYDPWNKGSTFRLSLVQVTPEEEARLAEISRDVGCVVLAVLGLFVLYGILRGLGALAFALARRRRHLPRWLVKIFDGLDRMLLRLARWPSLPKFKRRIRISRSVSKSIRYSNPMAQGEPRGRAGIAQAVATSYDALCALACDIGVPRREHQTPYEFIQSFPKELEGLRDEALNLTQLYVRSQYSDLEPDPRTFHVLRRFWITFEQTRRQLVH
ncbi:MAG TPA: DUF4129 domain-containing protein [Candidatus Hydrogenedentes bacterium]|nr:DUF4129 domain-containing protein [Candidatus Hydrogenedentota bacterium]